jgi:hypothetical protein
MKLNQITPESIRQASDREVLALHWRMHQLAAPFIKAQNFDDPRFQNIVSRHRLIVFEMIRRGLRFKVNDELDKRSAPEISAFLEVFTKSIPSRLGDMSKLELIRMHNQVHSVWEVIHSKDVSITQQEQLWNWHKLIIRELEKRGIEHPTNWDSLDQPLGRALGSPNMYPSGEEVGNWVFIEEVVQNVPKEITIEKQIVLVDSEKKLIYLSDVGGRQLIKVMYFRILRQFPREEWSAFRAAKMDEIESVNVSYDLCLKKLEPLWTVQLSLQFGDLCLVKPYLYLVGGVVTQGASKNDIDVLLRGGLEAPLEDKVFGTFVNQFPERLKSRFSKLRDEGLGPYTSYVGVYSLHLVKGEDK